MRTLRTISLVTVMMMVALPATAAPPKKLGVGLFAPELPFSNPGERYALVARIAQHLGNALGVEVEGRAYKTSADLERDVKARRVHLAVLGAVYLASRRPLVVAQARTTTTATWSILARGKTSLADLKGKVLQIPRLGPLAAKFVENGLLGGNVVLAKHFKVAFTPDLYSAVATVRLGRASAVFAPTSTKGMVAVIPGVRIPPPGFAVLDRKLDPQLRRKATQAMLTFGAAMAGIQGWKAAGANAYGAVAAASRKKVNRMILSAARVERLRDEELVNLNQLRPELPGLENLFWLP